MRYHRSSRARERLLCILISVLVIPACRDAEDEPLTFRYQLIEEPVSLDPAKQLDFFSSAVIDRVFDTLFRLDRIYGAPKPELARSYTVSDDGLTYELHLREGARFHNGRPVSATDVKYSWERLLHPATRSPADWMLDMITGVDDFRAGKSHEIIGIEVIGPSLLRVRLAEPFVPFLHHLCFPSASIVPREEVERLGEDFGYQPVGSGPFRFTAWAQNHRIVLERFDDHPLYRPDVERLIYQVISNESQAIEMFRQGRLDLVTQMPLGDLRGLQQAFPGQLRQFPGLLWGGFCFRIDRPPFDDVRVRRAFSLAMDRDALVRELGELRHVAGFGFLPQGVMGHSPLTLGSGYDLEAARALLAEAGFPGGENFPSPTLYVALSERQETIARFVVESLAGLGIESDFKMQRFDSLSFGFTRDEIGFFSFVWGVGHPDADLYTRPLFHSRGSRNSSGYQDPEVDRLLDRARIEEDLAKRNSLYRQAEVLVLEDLPCVALLQHNEVILLAEGWRDLPLGLNGALLEIEKARRVERSR